MNIIKLQNMLRGVPDEALIGYVQNPQGEVPSYLALSELQRRKDTRAKYQAEQAPESSVAEDLQQETMPAQGGLAMLAKNPVLSPGAPTSQGVADLPINDDMYQEDSFASGGIVAFQKGGYSYSPDYDPVEQYRRARQLGEANLMARRYNMPTTSVTSAGVETPYDASLSYYQDLRNEAAKSGKGLVDLTDTVNTLQKRREAWLSGSLDPYTQTSPVGSKPNMEGLQKPVVSTNKPSTEPDVRLTGDPTTGNQTGQRGSSSGFNANVYDNMLIKDKTLQELSDEYKAVLGTDPTLPGRQEKLAKMEARAARQEEMAPWMALTEAGFKTMAGTSPFALTNLGAGAETGLKSYAAAQDRLANLEERRFALDNELARQQRAEQMAAITFGDRSRQHTQEINKSIMLAKEKDRLARDEMNLRASVELATKSATNAPKAKDIAEARANYVGSDHYKKTVEQLKKKYGDDAAKPTNFFGRPNKNYENFMRDLDIAREQYLAEIYSPIGANIPRASTQGFEITKPTK